MPPEVCPKCARKLAEPVESCPYCGVIFAKLAQAESPGSLGPEQSAGSLLRQFLLIVEPGQKKSVDRGEGRFFASAGSLRTKTDFYTHCRISVYKLVVAFGEPGFSRSRPCCVHAFWSVFAGTGRFSGADLDSGCRDRRLSPSA